MTHIEAANKRLTLARYFTVAVSHFRILIAFVQNLAEYKHDE